MAVLNPVSGFGQTCSKWNKTVDPYYVIELHVIAKGDGCTEDGDMRMFGLR